MSLGKDQQVDQDALAAEWGLALESDAATAAPAAEDEGGFGRLRRRLPRNGPHDDR